MELARVRLDKESLVALVAALIHDTAYADPIGVAVEQALHIVNLADEKVKISLDKVRSSR